MELFIHTRDLRVHDNKGLAHAADEGDVLPVYIRDPRLEDRMGPNQRSFRDQALRSLHQKYVDEGGGLMVKENKIETAVRDIINEYTIDQIWINRSYTPLRRKLQDTLLSIDQTLTICDDSIMVPPDAFDTDHDTFSPFYQEWKAKDKDDPVDRPSNIANITPEQPVVKTETSIELPPAAEQTAIERWKSFRDSRLIAYKQDRDTVADPDAVSRLSCYYSLGILSVRTVLDDIETLIGSTEDSRLIKNAAKYRSELAWREFFYHVLFHNPEAVDSNYKDFERPINWQNDEKEIEAWKQGQTGIPFVDAGIRELRETGYMHNRLRQNVASFLTKHLMADWRIGASFFRKHLLDHDTASNNGGWQWSASTGTDSVPIRIFNPVKQGKRYDPDADYITRWIPEMRELGSQTIHNWATMDQKERNKYDIDYPDPIIDMNDRYHQGKQMFERALGFDDQGTRNS